MPAKARYSASAKVGVPHRTDAGLIHFEVPAGDPKAGYPLPGLPPSLSTTAQHGPWGLYAHWRITGGRPEPHSVNLSRTDGEPVTADAIRKLPLGAMLDESRRALRDRAGEIRAQYPAVGEAFASAVLEPIATTTGSKRGRSLTDAELQEVVDVYRRARLIGEPVTAAVQRLGLSRDGAAKRIVRARAWLREKGEEL